MEMELKGHIPEEGKGRRRGYLWLLLAFVIPFVVIWIAFAIQEVYPYGDRLITESDAWHQYYPFLVELQAKLKSGDCLFYTWNNGMGTSFLALMAYYCASPLNLLVVLFPTGELQVAFALLVSLKIGAAGLFCAAALRGAYGRRDASETVLGCCYALCAYFMGFFWNIMWLDTVALFPLVALGTLSLVREGRFRLYIISLALALISNFLIGLYVCIFTFFAFFLLCISLKTTGRVFFKRFFQIGGSTVISLALTAFLMLPTYLALMNTAGTNSTFPSWSLRISFLDLFGNFSAFIEPTGLTGLPNLYCGLPCLLLAALYFTSRKIPRRQKLCTLAMLALLIVCMNVRPLEFMWNGFHNNNMLPYRFSFQVSFVLIMMAGQALPEIFSLTRWKALALAIVSVLMLVLFGRSHDASITMANAIALLLYIGVLLAFEAKFLNKRLAALLLCVLVCGELTVNTLNAFRSSSFPSYDNYPRKEDEITALLDAIDRIDDSFYRVECVPKQTLNDPALLGYRGVSSFSSMAIANVSDLTRVFGLAARATSNRYNYPQIATAPVNLLFGLKYIISKDGTTQDTVYLREITESGGVTAYRNEAYVSIGFMTDDAMGAELVEDENPFVTQNSAFSAATGSDEGVFDLVDIIHVGHENLSVGRIRLGNYGYSMIDSSTDGTMRYNYEMPRSGLLYAYIGCDQAEIVTIQCGDGSKTVDITDWPYVFCAGYYEEGDLVTFSWTVEAGLEGEDLMEIYVAMLDETVLDDGIAALSDEALQVESHSSTSIVGAIEVKETGYFYTSIPYEAGWTLYVDGEEREITPYQDTFIGLEGLEPGVHTIELEYVPAGFMPGVVISGVGLLVFAVVWFCCYGPMGKKRRAARAAQEAQAPQAENGGEQEAAPEAGPT